MKFLRFDFKKTNIVKLMQVAAACLILVLALGSLAIGNAVWKKVLTIGGNVETQSKNIETKESENSANSLETDKDTSTSKGPLTLLQGYAYSVHHNQDGIETTFNASHMIGNVFTIDLGELRPGSKETVLAAAYIKNNTDKSFRVRADVTGEMAGIIEKVSFSRKGDDRANYMMAPYEKIALNIWLYIPKDAFISKYGGYIRLHEPGGQEFAKIPTKLELINNDLDESEQNISEEENSQEENSPVNEQKEVQENVDGENQSGIGTKEYEDATKYSEDASDNQELSTGNKAEESSTSNDANIPEKDIDPEVEVDEAEANEADSGIGEPSIDGIEEVVESTSS